MISEQMVGMRQELKGERRGSYSAHMCHSFDLDSQMCQLCASFCNSYLGLKATNVPGHRNSCARALQS